MTTKQQPLLLEERLGNKLLKFLGLRASSSIFFEFVKLDFDPDARRSSQILLASQAEAVEKCVLHEMNNLIVHYSEQRRHELTLRVFWPNLEST